MIQDVGVGAADGRDCALLAEQVEFYRADAESFDTWLAGLLDGDNDDPTAVTYRAGRARVAHAFSRMAPLGQVLEIAAGTGRLVELYSAKAESVVLLDASPESLAIAKRRLRAIPAIRFVVADIFDWDGEGSRFDLIVFTAWLHHVPHGCFEEFWCKIESLLAPGGRVIFDVPDVNVAAPGRADVPPEPSEEYEFYAPVDGISIRDHFGQRWRVVHNLWDIDELRDRLDALGWTVDTFGTGHFANIVWAQARR
jgi:SAM-dependent methyltransferase